MLSPGFVSRLPEHKPTFEGDISSLGKLKKAKYDAADLVALPTDYQWCYDLQFMLDNRPNALAVDTEGTGLRWHQDSTKVICVQLSPAPGISYIVPVDEEYIQKWQSHFPADLLERLPTLRAQLKEILEDGNIQKMGCRVPPVPIGRSGALERLA